MTDPETRAAEVLSDLPRTIWDGRALPVPIEDIADSHMRLHVCESQDLAGVPGAPALPEGETLSGLLVVGAREIWVNAAEAMDSPGRRRFTIGHEMGHWCLHRDDHDRVFCRSSHVLPDNPAEAGPDIEDEASRFAGALMFPEELVRAQWTRLRGDLDRLCARFEASKVATRRAVFRIIRLPEVLESAPDIDWFFWDDDAYDAWRLTHQDTGYVVNGALTDDEGDAKLHRMSCHYMNRPARAGQPRTASPKWCSEDLDELRRTFPGAKRCTSCNP